MLSEFGKAFESFIKSVFPNHWSGNKLRSQETVENSLKNRADQNLTINCLLSTNQNEVIF